MYHLYVLNSLFYPKSLAVIGASRSLGKVGNAVITNIRDSLYNGKIYPINPKHDKIYGIKTFESILDIDDNVDLFIIVGIRRLSKLAPDFPSMQELDINPLVVYEKNAITLDARIIIHMEQRGGS